MTAPTGNILTFFTVDGDYQSVDDPAPQSTTSTPEMEMVQALVTFTARVPRGFTAFVPDYQLSLDTNCTQTVEVIGAVTGGAYGLNFNGVWTPTPIPAGSTAADVQTLMEAVSTIGAGNITVTGPDGGPYSMEFINALGSQKLTQMLSNPAGLTVSSGSPYVSVVMLNPGSTSRVGPAAIAIPPRTGRLWTTGQLCSINVADSPSVELLSNTAILGLDFDLIYDVTFSLVTYGDTTRDLAPFGFTAPTDGSPVSLTDPTLDRLVFSPPIATTWYPGWTPKPLTSVAAVGSGATVVPLAATGWKNVG